MRTAAGIISDVPSVALFGVGESVVARILRPVSDSAAAF